MKIKSLDELKKIRENATKKVNLRESGNTEGEMIELLIGMATCGIASGARDTLKEILRLIEEKNLKNIKVIQVGCLGFCHSEPTVQVNVPGHQPILYGNVDKEVAKEIINEHIMNNKLVDNHILIKSFDKA